MKENISRPERRREKISQSSVLIDCSGLVAGPHSPCCSVGMVARLDEWKGTA